MSNNKKYASNSSDANKSSNINSATPYKRKYGIDLLLQVDPFFLEEGELEGALACHQELSQLLEGATVLNGANRKDFVQGTVVAKTKDGYLVNIKRKYDAFVPLVHATGLTLGQEAEFFVIAREDQNNNNNSGLTTISFTMAQGWRALESAQGTGEIFNARVFSEAITKRTQKSAGLRVQFEEGNLNGIRGFIPNGEVARHTASKDLVGKTIQVTIIKAEPQMGSEHGNLVLSHKEAQGMADEISFNAMQVRTLVEGKIFAFLKASPKDTKMSALIKLDNGLTAMLHRSETVDNHDSLSDMYKVGDNITAAVREIDSSKKRIGLSLKLAAQMHCLAMIAPNVIVEAKILREVVYGYFVAIGGGFEGLLHKFDLATSNGRCESFRPGDITKVVILSFEAEGTRLALGRKQLFENHSQQ